MKIIKNTNFYNMKRKYSMKETCCCVSRITFGEAECSGSATILKLTMQTN